jgi:mono/diheme cytochrome c family protein
LFWITKNGLSFMAMPGFGDQYSDQDIWNIVAYMRSLQNWPSAAVNVPSPTFAQLQAADPNGDPVARGAGAAVYFAQGCQSCHGPVGDAPANLALRGAGETGAIRRGRPGMPAYGTDRISDAQLADLQAYMRTFAGSRGRGPGGEREQSGGGWSFLRKLSRQADRDQPVVLVWSVMEGDALARARLLGAAECLRRETTDPDSLLEAIARLLHGGRAV